MGHIWDIWAMNLVLETHHEPVKPATDGSKGQKEAQTEYEHHQPLLIPSSATGHAFLSPGVKDARSYRQSMAYNSGVAVSNR
jgi:hypothetical protein